MLNHSFQPNCFFHWRFKDRMLEVMINAGQQIKKGDEVLVTNFLNLEYNNYMPIYNGSVGSASSGVKNEKICFK